MTPSYRAKKVGLPPGTLVQQIEKFVSHQKIRAINYNQQSIHEVELASLEESFDYCEKADSVTWITIENTSDPALLNEVGTSYGIHPLVLEDIQNTDQRPKIEIFDDYIFIVLRLFKPGEGEQLVNSEQISFILGTNYIISFQEKPSNLFEPVKERLRKSSGRIRRMGADYLTYTLIDTVVDHYFVTIEKFGEHLEDLEDSLMEDSDADGRTALKQIHGLKRELISARKSIWPMREVISSMQKAECALIKESTEIFLKDVHDHTVQIIDAIESYRDMLSGMLDVYLSSTSNKMNSVMKVLTVITTIFIPLTFIAGVYGMNFKHMPELEWSWGYYGVWAINLILAGIMIYMFKRNKWL